VGRSPPDASMVSDRSPEDEALPQSRAARAGVPPQPCENAAPPISPHARSLISPSSPAVTNRRGGFKVGRTTPARPARAKRQRAKSPHRQERVDAHTSGGHGDAERRADQEQDLPSFLAGPVRHVGFATPWPTVTQATVVQNSKMAQIRCKLSIIGPTRVAGRSGQQGPGAECPLEPLPSPPRVPSKAGFRPLRLPGADRFIGPANGLRVEQQSRKQHSPGQQGQDDPIDHVSPPICASVLTNRWEIPQAAVSNTWSRESPSA
jgi:hypothetical protein